MIISTVLILIITMFWSISVTLLLGAGINTAAAALIIPTILVLLLLTVGIRGGK